MTLGGKPVKVGDKLIERGRVYRVFDIKTATDSNTTNGSSNGHYHGKMVHYRPFFRTAENKTLVCCFPLDSLEQINVRRPVDAEILRELLSELSKQPTETEPLDINQAKEALELNDPNESVKLLRSLWRDKSDNGVVFTKSKSEVFKRAKSRFCEEVAVVISISLDKADEKIDKALGRASK